MGTTQTAPQTLEQRIDLAAEQAGQIAATFSPTAGALIESGVAIEPVISGFIQMIAALFHHHAKQAAAQVATK